ncbi:MAG: Hsp20/alpha crystallin family protein [Gaiellales bacterium]
MAIVSWDPSQEISLLQGDMNHLFERFFGSAAPEKSRRWSPAMDMSEEGGYFVLRSDLPGISEDDVKIEIHDRTLSISGERNYEQKTGEDSGYIRMERSFGRFERSVTLPEGVDFEAIEASFDRGVLELRIPKPVEAEPRRIEITTNGKSSIEGHATDDDADETKRSSQHGIFAGRSNNN